MTRFLRALGALAERLLGTYYQGPEPPADRHRELVLLFAEAHPRATRREWMDLAAAMAGEAWRSGYAQGYEHTEREPGELRRLVRRSEEAADALDPAWRERAGEDEEVGDRAGRHPWAT